MHSSSFANRARRVDLSFPLVFEADGVASKGHCLNLSESGLLATFSPTVDLWVTGDLQIEVAEIRAKLRARAARVDGNQIGMAFMFRTDSEREAIRRLVDLAERQTHLRGARPPF